MESKHFTKGLVLIFVTILSSFTLFGYSDLDEVPPPNLPIAVIIQKIPPNTKGISSIEYVNGRWKITTVVPASNNGIQAGKEKTGRFLTETCIFNPMSDELEPMGTPEYHNNEKAPPDFNSLKKAAVAVLKAIPNINITAIEFVKNNWEIRLMTNRTQAGTSHPFEDKSTYSSKTEDEGMVSQTKQFMRYTVDPKTFKIKGSHIDD